MIDKETVENFLKTTGKTQTELIFHAYKTAATRFSNNSITQNVQNEDMEVDLRIIQSGRSSKVSANNLSEKTLKKLWDKALDINRFSKEDKSTPDLLDASDSISDKDAFFEKTVEIDPSARAEIVRKCVEEAKKKNMEAAGFLRNGSASILIATNKGMRREHLRSFFSLSLSVMNDEGSGWSSASSFDAERVPVDDVVKKAVEKADAGRKLQILPPGPYTVILEPAAVADLMAFLGYGSFAGLSFIEKRSFMSDSIGKKIMSEKITITDDVRHDLFKACPFDYEGTQTKKVILIENGVAKGVVHDRKTAMMAKTESTGHSLPQPNSHGPFPRALVMSKGNDSIEDMISSTDNGILVSRFHYTNMLDPLKVTVTGMTRDGLFLIEKGKVTKALKNFRFTESVINAFSNVEMVGDELKLTSGFFGGGYVNPSLKIKDFHFSSNAEF